MRENLTSKSCDRRIPGDRLDKEVRKIFTLPPFVSFKSARNLRGHLVRSKIYPLVRDAGSTKYQNKKCQVCYNVRETDLKLFTILSINLTTNFTVMMNVQRTYLTVRFVGNNTSHKQLIDLGYVRITTKRNNRKVVKGLEHRQVYLFNHIKTEGHTGFLNDVEKSWL